MAKNSDIPCAFDGNLNRVDICTKEATVFFRSAQGTIWPLCRACSDRQKAWMVRLVTTDQLNVPTAVGAAFDVPITDAETRDEFRKQDPERLRAMIAIVDDPRQGEVDA